MDDHDQAKRDAQKWVDQQGIECPNCKTKGPWNFSDITNMIGKPDPRTGVSYDTPIVRITCANPGCEYETEEPYEVKDDPN